MTVCSAIEMVQDCTVKVVSVDGKFEMTTSINIVDKGILLTVPDPKYEEQTNKYCHLQGAGQKTSTCPPVQEEYSFISDKWLSKSTCPTGRVEFATKKVLVFS